MRTTLHLTYILLLFSLSISAQSVKAPADTVDLGVVFPVVVTTPQDSLYTYRLNKHEEWQGFTRILSATSTTKESLSVTTFEVAVYQAPLCTLELPTLIKTPKDPKDTGLSAQEDTLPTIVISSRSVIPDSLADSDSLQSHDFHDPFKAGKFPWHIPLMILGIALLIAGIIYTLWYYAKGTKKVAPPTPPINPYDEAMQALSLLKEQRLPEKKEIKLFVFTLSEILKRYLGRSYKATIQESTSQEFLAWLESSTLSREARGTLEKFIAQTEPIKFADRGSTTPELEEFYDMIELFINENHEVHLAALLEKEEQK